MIEPIVNHCKDSYTQRTMSVLFNSASQSKQSAMSHSADLSLFASRGRCVYWHRPYLYRLATRSGFDDLSRRVVHIISAGRASCRSARSVFVVATQEGRRGLNL